MLSFKIAKTVDLYANRRVSENLAGINKLMFLTINVNNILQKKEYIPLIKPSPKRFYYH